ncbi:hypothetical protein HZB04_02265 [Candidatus Wolfebacteria bacterium]|nr:hypothetical protein [Candidatus Wolfebacteria bacterium]
MEIKHNHENHCFFCDWKGIGGNQRKHIIIRWILGIIILTTVFYFGFKIGEISNIIKGEFYGYSMMSGYGYPYRGTAGSCGGHYGGYDYDYGMMGSRMMR